MKAQFITYFEANERAKVAQFKRAPKRKDSTQTGCLLNEEAQAVLFIEIIMFFEHYYQLVLYNIDTAYDETC